MDVPAFKPKDTYCWYHVFQYTVPSSSYVSYASGNTNGNSVPLSPTDDAPISQVAHSTLSPKSTYSWPSIVPVVGLPVDCPSQEFEHVPLHVELQPLAQSEHPLFVVLLLHAELQLLLHALVQSEQSKGSSGSEPGHAVRKGVSVTAPIIGNTPFAAFLKNSRRVWSFSFL